jgi:hypothetical protein
MNINRKKRYVIFSFVLTLLFFSFVLTLLFTGIFSVNAALLHSGNNFFIKIDGVDRTLQYAINNNLFAGSHTYALSSSIPNPGHSANEIWVSVKDGEMNLLQALSSTNKLCPRSPPKTSYTGPSDKSKAYHYASEIEISTGKSFQQAIDNGEFPPGPSCYPSGSESSCTNAGVIQCDGTCRSYSFKAKGTACSGSGSCGGYWACNGAGNCVCASGTLKCYSSSTNSITLSYSFSNSISSKVSIFRGSTKLISYTGSSGTGTYTSSGLSSGTSYTFYLRDGDTTGSPLLAQVSCSTSSSTGHAAPEPPPPDYSNLPDRVVDGGGGGGGKVICTELYTTGVMSEETYQMDVQYARTHFSKEAIYGYQAWAIPVVKAMRESQQDRDRVIPLVNSFMEEIAYRSGKRETGNEVGKLFLDEAVPLFERIGKYIDEPDWKSLFTEKSLLYYLQSLFQKENKYNEIVKNYFTEEKVREMFYDAERKGGNSQLAVAKALIENLRKAVEEIESLINRK